ISKLVNRGYQQFLKTAKTEVPATADHLKALQQFTEELKEGLGLPVLYNESLGTVSESYHYDRIKDRDKPKAERPRDHCAGGTDSGHHCQAVQAVHRQPGVPSLSPRLDRCRWRPRLPSFPAGALLR